jgi:hypothetical protein
MFSQAQLPLFVILKGDGMWPLLVVIPEGNLRFARITKTTSSRQSNQKRTSSRPKRSVVERPCISSSVSRQEKLIFHQLMPGRQHTLMKHPTDENAAIIRSVKNDMLLVFYAPKAGMDRTAQTPDLRRLRNPSETFDEAVEINLRLLTAPNVSRVVDDIREIKFC